MISFIRSDDLQLDVENLFLIVIYNKYYSYDVSEKLIVITISCLLCRGFLSSIGDEDDLTVMIVVQYPQHVHKMAVLSNNYPS